MTQAAPFARGVEAGAHRLIEYHAAAEPHVEKAYLFPHSDEIRLVEVDATALPSDTEDIVAFHFAQDPKSGVHHRFAIAIIRPEEVHVLHPPTGWGDWDSATLIWSRA